MERKKTEDTKEEEAFDVDSFSLLHSLLPAHSFIYFSRPSLFPPSLTRLFQWRRKEESKGERPTGFSHAAAELPPSADSGEKKLIDSCMICTRSFRFKETKGVEKQ